MSVGRGAHNEPQARRKRAEAPAADTYMTQTLVPTFTAKPSISMRDFFNLPAVVAMQDTQKANPFGSPAHREATSAILILADRYNCAQYFE